MGIISKRVHTCGSEVVSHFMVQSQERRKVMVFSSEPLGAIKCTQIFYFCLQVYNSNKDSQSEGSKYDALCCFPAARVGSGL